MDDKTAVEIANTYVASAGFSTEGLRANVENPSNREVEIAFSLDAPEQSLGEHTVFIGPYGDFLGLLLPDGTKAPRPQESEISTDYNEDPIDSAIRFLQAHGIDTKSLRPRLVEPTRLVTVWYDRDTEELVMGGWFTVFLTETGMVLHLQEDQ